MISFKEGIKIFNTEWVLEGFEQNKSHKLSGKLPRQIWEIQFKIVDSKVRKELSKRNQMWFGFLSTSLLFGLLVFIHSHDNFWEVSRLIRSSLIANSIKHKGSLFKDRGISGNPRSGTQSSFRKI